MLRLIQNPFGVASLACSLALMACTEPNPNADGSGGESEAGESESTTSTEGGSEESDDGHCPNGGEMLCDGECVDVQTDELHCGDCNAPCGDMQECIAGECTTVCDEGQELCGDTCADLQSDAAHCGACDVNCGEGWSCSEAACVNDRSWSAPLRVDDEDMQGASNHRAAATEGGDAFVVWEEMGNGTRVLGSRLPDGASEWETPELIMHALGGQTYGLNLTIDGLGTPIAAWGDDYSWAPQEALYSSRWDTTSQVWGDPEYTAVTDITQPVLTVDSNGSALVAWIQHDPAHEVHGMRWDSGSDAWTSVETIDIPNVNLIDAGSLRVAGYADDLQALWFENDGLTHGLTTSRYTPTGDWTNGSVVGEFDDNLKGGHGLLYDANGDTAVVWRQYNSGDYSLRVAVRPNGENNFGTPVDLPITEEGMPENLDYALLNGQLIAVWQQDDTVRIGCWTARFDLGAGTWTQPERVESNFTEHAYDPRVIMDAAGNGTVLFFQETLSDTNGQLRFRQWNAGSQSWGDDALVSLIDSGVGGLSLGRDDSGGVLATWATTAGTAQIWASWFE